MKKKITTLALTALLFALCSSAQAQQPAKIARIGFLSGSGNPKSPGLQVEAFQQGLRNLGYIEGKTSCLSTASLKEWRIEFQVSLLNL